MYVRVYASDEECIYMVYTGIYKIVNVYTCILYHVQLVSKAYRKCCVKFQTTPSIQKCLPALLSGAIKTS